MIRVLKIKMYPLFVIILRKCIYYYKVVHIEGIYIVFDGSEKLYTM